jgi:hypothetical protein
MNCRQAQREIALLAGEDLNDEDRRRDVQRHLDHCPACREQQAKVGVALSALVAAEPHATYDSVHSLWPGVRRRLRNASARTSTASDWKSWAPFAAGVATCAGVLLLAGGAFEQPAPRRAVEVNYSRELPIYPSMPSVVETPIENQDVIERPGVLRGLRKATDER